MSVVLWINLNCKLTLYDIVLKLERKLREGVKDANEQ